MNNPLIIVFLYTLINLEIKIEKKRKYLFMYHNITFPNFYKNCVAKNILFIIWIYKIVYTPI